MIGRKYRLPAGAFPVHSFKQARSEYFLLKASKNSLGHGRFATTVSSRVDKRSVRRHFWKRRILDWAKRESNAPADILISVLPPLNKLSEKDAEKEFKNIFSEVLRAFK